MDVVGGMEGMVEAGEREEACEPPGPCRCSGVAGGPLVVDGGGLVGTMTYDA